MHALGYTDTLYQVVNVNTIYNWKFQTYMSYNSGLTLTVYYCMLATVIIYSIRAPQHLDSLLENKIKLASYLAAWTCWFLAVFIGTYS